MEIDVPWRPSFVFPVLYNKVGSAFFGSRRPLKPLPGRLLSLRGRPCSSPFRWLLSGQIESLCHLFHLLFCHSFRLKAHTFGIEIDLGTL